MPIFTYRCPDGHITELYLPKHKKVTRGCGHRSNQGNRVGCCDLLIEQIITAPLMVKVCADVRYDSPIDGKPITNWDARREDLKRNNCQPYDEGMKQDYHRRIKESDDALDKTIDVHVEEAIEKMPTKQRGKLYSELTEQGMTAEAVRL